MNRKPKLLVIGIFAFAGALAVVLNNLQFRLSFIGEYVLLRELLMMAGPSLIFATVILVAAMVVFRLRLVQYPLSMRRWRIALAWGILASTYPIALWSMILVGGQMMAPSNSNNPNPVPLTPWQRILDQSALPVAFLFGGLATLRLVSVAFRVAVRKTPPRMWATLVTLLLGVPLLTILAAWVIGAFWPEAIGGSASDLPGLLLTGFRGDYEQFLLLILGEPILAGVLGYWLVCAVPGSSVAP